MLNHHLSGIYVASLTPITNLREVDSKGLLELLNFYANNGCHGALLLGTTGEGPSFDSKSRKIIWQVAVEIKNNHPNFRLLAGTGSPSLEETINYNKYVFDLGYDGVVVLPPYYFRNASEGGLYSWFAEVINKSVPLDGNFLGYHIPQVSGIGLSISLLKRLRDNFPNQFVGLKDSTGDINHAKLLVDALPESVILVGNDKLLLPSLEFGSSGCITAGANLESLLLRKIWEEYNNGVSDTKTHDKIVEIRTIMEKHTPYPSSLKSIMHKLFDMPLWKVTPPLENYPINDLAHSIEEIKSILNE